MGAGEGALEARRVVGIAGHDLRAGCGQGTRLVGVGLARDRTQGKPPFGIGEDSARPPPCTPVAPMTAMIFLSDMCRSPPPIIDATGATDDSCGSSSLGDQAGPACLVSMCATLVRCDGVPRVKSLASSDISYAHHLAARVRDRSRQSASARSSAPICACPECPSGNTAHPAWDRRRPSATEDPRAQFSGDSRQRGCLCVRLRRRRRHATGPRRRASELAAPCFHHPPPL